MNSTPTDADLGADNASSLPTFEGHVSDYMVFQTILLFLSTLLLLTLNPLCLLVLRHVDSIPETTKVFLQSLTAADLGIGICSALPMTISAVSGTWVLGDVVCILQPLALAVCATSSQLSLIMLTVDRYISVEYALRYSSIVTVKRAWVAVLCSWGIAVVYAISTACLHSWISVYYAPSFLCVFFYSLLALYIVFGTSVILFFCILTVIPVTYIRLFIISRRHARRIHADNQVAGDGHMLVKSNHKTVQTILIIALTTLVCTVLPFVCWLLRHILPPDSINQITFFFMMQLPLLTNSWLNVVIYYLRNKDIRRATRTLLTSYYMFFKQHFSFQRK